MFLALTHRMFLAPTHRMLCSSTLPPHARTCVLLALTLLLHARPVQLCREGAMQIREAAKGRDVRLVAIAKERLGHEEFTREYWPSPAELYFDTVEPGYPFFRASNGESLGLIGGIVSYLLGGEVATNLKRSENIAGNNRYDWW